jgi:hypothetical protein
LHCFHRNKKITTRKKNTRKKCWNKFHLTLNSTTPQRTPAIHTHQTPIPAHIFGKIFTMGKMGVKTQCSKLHKTQTHLL